MKKFYRFRSVYPMIRGTGAILAVAAGISGCANMPAPGGQIAASKVAIDNASNAGSREFAPQQLKYALRKMDAAEQAMTKKDYRSARQLAEQVQVDAQLAAVTARLV
ncbi:MAG: DUF4398 domain-containing protein, partial [Methylobacter sp.]